MYCVPWKLSKIHYPHYQSSNNLGTSSSTYRWRPWGVWEALAPWWWTSARNSSQSFSIKVINMYVECVPGTSNLSFQRKTSVQISPLVGHSMKTNSGKRGSIEWNVLQKKNYFVKILFLRDILIPSDCNQKSQLMAIEREIDGSESQFNRNSVYT